MKREFKYYPEDFKEPPVKPEHMDLVFDVYDDHADVTSDFRMTALRAVKSMELNAKNLDIRKVSCSKKISSKYDKKENKLAVTFMEPVKKGDKIVLHTETTCRPTHNELEGLYYDKTPEGAPPQLMTQCQQWGFQKLVPCFDEMNAKCTYRTRIVADSRYTHMISNGDIAQEKKDLGNGRSEIIYDNTKTPMAPYLFCLILGTFDAHRREFEYPDGKKFTIELLALPGSDREAAAKALEMIFTGAMWIHIFTGKERFRDAKERERLFALVQERERLKLKAALSAAEENRLGELRKEIRELGSRLVLGYEYTGTFYREIAMQNSNFGGMENVGNTTITANRLLPAKETSDGAFAYMMEVKTHEFYHNINGSEVTGWSPFELWLNEAITCDSESDYLKFVAGEKYSRLAEVTRIIFPDGTFDEDSGSLGMPIIPKGFNTPDELISDVTYSKAPEFVKMVTTLMGKEKYALALERYHKKHSHGNATTNDWINEMEKASGLKLKRMADAWLMQTGYPTLKIKTRYDPKKRLCTIDMKQSGYKKGKRWEFPLAFAIFTKKGKAHEETALIKAPKTILKIKGIDGEPEFYSFNRNFSFYGKVDHRAGEDELYAQAEKDDDMVARYCAFYRIADGEKMRLIEGKVNEPSDRFVDLYFRILSDKKLGDEMGGAMLSVPESVEDKKKRHLYEELYRAKKRMREKIAKRHKKQLLEIYEERKNRTISAPFVKKQFFDIKNRQIKNTCLSILAELGTPEIIALAREQLHNPLCQTDKLVALSLYIDSPAEGKNEVITEFEEKMKKSPIEWEQFLSIVANNESDDALGIVKRVRASKNYNITQSNDQRALLVRFAMNRRKSLLTEEGRKFLKESLLELGPINEYNACYLLSVFSQLDDMQEHTLEPLMKILVTALDSFDQEKIPSVYNTIRRLIKGAPKAVKAYEGVHGKLADKYF